MWSFIIGIFVGIIAAGIAALLGIKKGLSELGIEEIFEKIKNGDETC